MLGFFASHFIYPLIIPGFMAGLAAILLSFFLPSVLGPYKYIALAIGCVAVLFFTYEGGKYSEEKEYAAEQAEIKAENSRLNAKSVEITADSTVKFVDKIKYVDRWKEVKTNVYVNKSADQKCVIDPDTSKSIRMLYNDSIQGILPEAPNP